MIYNPNSIRQPDYIQEAEDLENLESHGVDPTADADGGIINNDALLESMFCDKISRLSDEEKQAYLESAEFQNLVEAGVVGKRSVVRISKNDDLTRRIHLAALQKAKESGDADWEALRKNRIQERKLLNKIYAKYANKVRGDAIRAQRRLIKLSPQVFDMSKQVR